MFFRISQKVAKYLGYFGNKNVTKNFKKPPNLVTLDASITGLNLNRLVTLLWRGSRLNAAIKPHWRVWRPT